MEKALKILLVEDDEVDILNIRRAFKKNKLKHQLFVEMDGQAGLDFLLNPENPRPDIILSDINLPRMNGIEFIGEIRKNESLSSLVVFVLTTSDDDKDKLNAFNLNVAGYIVKPVMYDAFLEAIKTLDDYWQFLTFK